MTNPFADFVNAGCIMVIGSNTTEAHPIGALAIIRARREFGAKLIVVNPKRIDLCDHADLWIRHRPGTDVALLNGVARIILDDGLWDREFVETRTEGFAEFRASLEAYTPEFVSGITGVSVDDLKELARTYAAPSRGASAIVYAMGITQHRTGTDNVMAIANLAMLTGNLGKPGGGVNPLRGQSNVQGACDSGCLPDVFPGYQKVAVPEVRAKFEAAWGTSLSDRPGLRLTEMFDAVLRGNIRAMYIMGENPVLADADAHHVEEALKHLDFLVVQDIFLTETAQYADVVLPGAVFAEKQGTFTNTERRVQLLRKAIDPPGAARPDWQIICEIARRTAARLDQQPGGFDFSSTAEIMQEMASLTPSYGGISHERLDRGSLQWPCPNAEHPGTPILHVGKFTRGLGKFTPVSFIQPAELPDAEYPLLLTTGRLLYHFHTGTVTRRVAGLQAMAPEEFAEVNPLDAGRLGLADGDHAVLTSRRGRVESRVRVTDKVPEGVVSMTFHFAESPANVLTNAALDPVSKIAEFKVCAVRVQRAG
jgi:formate dehydrogenase alpha subunit